MALTNPRYADASGKIILVDKADGTVAMLEEDIGGAEWAAAIAGDYGAVAAYAPPPPPSAADLDALADSIAEELLEQDAKMKALGLVLADVVERAFGVSQSVARQQVKTRFRDYYRALLG